MSLHFDDLKEPPLSHREQLAAKASTFFIGLLCVTALALFPLGVAYKLYTQFLP